MTKVQIKHRFSGAVLFETEIAAKYDSHSFGFRLGLAVKAAYKSDADLSGAYLSGAVLRDAVLRDADLSGADLSGAVLSGAVLRGAVLSGAVLRDAVLRDAVLRGAVLSGADLRGADLSGADLRDAVLRGAVLRDAVLRGADLSGADLRDAVLRDAVLRDAKIIRVIARITRLDGYEFIAFETDKRVIIRAGCRTMSPDGYRNHVAREYPDTDKAEETLAILDYIEARAAKLCGADVSA